MSALPNRVAYWDFVWLKLVQAGPVHNDCSLCGFTQTFSHGQELASLASENPICFLLLSSLGLGAVTRLCL